MSNGCGCESGILRYIRPPYQETFYAACCMHDDDYDRGGDKTARRSADIRFYDNMIKSALNTSKTPWRVAWLAAVALCYYAAVRVFGRFYFNFTE